jgi:hypothetical protein
MNTNSMSTALDLAQAAYDKDFRWWFLALLICVLAGGVKIIHYLIKRDEVKTTAMYGAFDRNTEANLELGKQLALCRHTIERNIAVLERVETTEESQHAQRRAASGG